MGCRRTARGDLFRIVLDLVLLSRFLPANSECRASSLSRGQEQSKQEDPGRPSNQSDCARPFQPAPHRPMLARGAREGGFDAQRLADQSGALRRGRACAHRHPGVPGERGGRAGRRRRRDRAGRGRLPQHRRRRVRARAARLCGRDPEPATPRRHLDRAARRDRACLRRMGRRWRRAGGGRLGGDPQPGGRARLRRRDERGAALVYRPDRDRRGDRFLLRPVCRERASRPAGG